MPLTRAPKPCDSIKDYVIQQKVRDDLDLENVMFCKVDKWWKTDELIDEYLNTNNCWESTGARLYSFILKNLTTITESNIKKYIKTYCQRLLTYYQQPETKNIFLNDYLTKKRIKEVEKTNNELSIETRITANTLLINDHTIRRRELLEEDDISVSNILPYKRKASNTEDDSDNIDNFNEVSFISDTTDQSSYIPTSSPIHLLENIEYKKYILSLKEVTNFDSDNEVCSKMKNYISFEERLKISFIKFHQDCPDNIRLNSLDLDSYFYDELRKFRRLIKGKKDYFPTPFTPQQLSQNEDIFKRNLTTFLVSLDETLKCPPLSIEKKDTEIKLCIDHITSLFRFIFTYKDNVYISWETSSLTLNCINDTNKRMTTDFILHSNGQELGVGEVKRENTTEDLKEEDRCRLGESMKKMLHKRIKNAKNTKEFYTFGIFICFKNAELYMMNFSKEDGYNLFLLDNNVILPTFSDTCNYLEESIEILLGFKKKIVDSLLDREDVKRPCIFQDYSEYLKPTVYFV